MRSRDVWAQIESQAGIAVHQRGLLMAVRRPAAMDVLQDFAAGPMGGECQLLNRTALRAAAPMLDPALVGALRSPHSLRVENRDAIPQLAAWLASQGVDFRTRTAVRAVEPGAIHTGTDTIRARHIVVCPGTDLVRLFPEVMACRGITLCKLHMLRLADPGVRFPSPIMSDLGLVRYLGYPGPRLAALEVRLRAAHPGLFLAVALVAPRALLLWRSFEGSDGGFVGLANYITYLSTPSLASSIWNSIWTAGVTAIVVVPTAFFYAYALQRPCIPLKPVFRAVALMPILALSLPPALALIYLFGNQGMLSPLISGSIYGPWGIVVAQIFYTLPHAVLILGVALSAADARRRRCSRPPTGGSCGR